MDFRLTTRANVESSLSPAAAAFVTSLNLFYPHRELSFFFTQFHHNRALFRYNKHPKLKHKD